MKKAIPVLINFMRIFLILSLFVSCIGKNPDKAKDSLVPETEIIYSEKPVSVVTFESPASKNSQNKQPSEINDNTQKPDIDLTLMSATMIYSTVFQFFIDYEYYEGKTIKIQGIYTPFFRPETNRIYHNVVIQDATACCKEGLEFVWEDGKHENNEYPPEGTEIIVQGIFEQYYEDDRMEVMQIHLKNASMDIVRI